MASQHTSGPWTYLDLGEVVRGDDFDVTIATIDYSRDSAEADGNLIAAAPELYETAAQAVGYLERICGLVPGEELDLQDVRDLLADRRSFYRAAIAKAEGRS